MSKFIKEGSLAAEELAREASNAAKNEADYLDKKEKSERKSLQEQLYENRVRRAKEFARIAEEQNSAYKVSQKDVLYYESLKKEAELRELDRQIEEEENLQEFRRRQAQLKIQQGKIEVYNTEDDTATPVKKMMLKRAFAEAHTSASGQKKPNIQSSKSSLAKKTKEQPKLEYTKEESTVQGDGEKKAIQPTGLISGYESSSEEE